MTVYYCDSSVLVKRHVSEVGSPWFSVLVDDQSAALFTAQISIVEVCSALNRLRESHFGVVEYQRMMAQVRFLFNVKYEVIELSDQIVTVACSLLERQPLRGFDAIHLAKALLVRDRLDRLNEPTPTFLATDLNLLKAAAGEGLSTFNPSTIP
jgi:predicted nucleic acid-binding protein